MSLIPQSFIDDLLDRVDIVDVIDSRVKLKKAGKNYLACCPFHKEKTPSFSVSPDKQFYYCFGCGASGTAVTFLLEYEHLGFVDAVETLARSAGMQVPREQSDNKQKSHKNFYTILAKAAEYYQAQLRDNPKRDVPVDYLKARGLTGQVCKDFGVGFAPPGWDGLQAKLGLSDEDRRLLIDGGMVIYNEDNKSSYDRFRNRIMFPILDVRGRTIGFGGRVLSADEKGPKYLNSPETPVFHKGRELYGLYQARQQAGQIDHLLVVEGYMDVIALAQFGINNAVATLGTACGEDHLKLAFKHTSEVVFCFDGDNAGRKAARRALENSLPAMDDGRQVKFLFLPEGQDPDTLVRQIGKERFVQQIEEAVPLEEFFFDAVAEGVDVRTMEGRARMSKLASPMLHALPAGVYRELMFNSLAHRTGLSMEVLRELVDEPVPATKLERADVVIESFRNDREGGSQQGAPADLSGPFYGSDVADVELEAEGLPDAMWQQGLESSRPTMTSQPAAPRQAATFAKQTKLSPTRMAISLLLETPSLIAKAEDWDLPDEDDLDLSCLKRLVGYLKSRPQASFHSILGFWGGRYGMGAQKQLAQYVAGQFLGSVKRTAPYDAAKELRDAYWRIRQQYMIACHQKELSALAALPELTEEQKNRMKELLLLQTKARQMPH